MLHQVESQSEDENHARMVESAHWNRFRLRFRNFIQIQLRVEGNLPGFFSSLICLPIFFSYFPCLFLWFLGKLISSQGAGGSNGLRKAWCQACKPQLRREKKHSWHLLVLKVASG